MTSSSMREWRCAELPLRWLRAGSYALLCVCMPALASGGQQPVQVHLHGWGRSCSGELLLRSRTISWITPWSPCRTTPFYIVEQHDTNGDLDRLYHLAHLSKGCSYPYIELTYGHGAPGLTWYAQEFTSFEAAQHKQSAHSLGCQLEQVPEQESKTQLKGGRRKQLS